MILGEQKKIPLKRAWGYIFFSVFMINSFAFIGISYYQYKEHQKRRDPSNAIVAIVQTTSQQEFLKPGHLTELLGLSVDRPANLFDFNTKEAENILKGTVSIKDAVIKKIRPGTIHVDYTLRIPLAFVGNFTNTAIDAEGVLFPIKPFFTQKRMPIIFFNEDLFKENAEVWGKTIDPVHLPLDILNKIPDLLGNSSAILAVDVSKIDFPSFGQRQIVITVEETHERVVNSQLVMVVAKRILRLFPSNWQHQLTNYRLLRSHLNELAGKKIGNNDKPIIYVDPIVVDLRLSNLAFIGS